jgi:hypothetical protein
MTTQRRLLASSTGKKLRARPRATRPFRPQRVYTADEWRLLQWLAKAHGEGGQAWAEEHAEMLLQQARDFGDL